MGIPEEASKVATGTIEALRTNPGLLVLVILQLATMGVLYVVGQSSRAQSAAREMALIERCFPLEHEGKEDRL
jgi:hypothetical protein